MQRFDFVTGVACGNVLSLAIRSDRRCSGCYYVAMSLLSRYLCGLNGPRYCAPQRAAERKIATARFG